MKSIRTKSPPKTVILAFVILLSLCLAALVYAEPLTLPIDQRPDWLQRDGIVMAGSWEPLLHRVRRNGEDYTITSEQRAAYLREHSPEMIARLKNLGVNFVMIHCYKGLGLEMERESMADAAKFAMLCHEAGLHVGVYNYSGAFHWQPFFKEVPQAKDWVLLDGNGKPRTYGSTNYRYYWNRNHPDAQAFYRKIVQFAVNDIKADLLHFDNYGVGPGSDTNSVQRFRQYLRDTFTAEQLKQRGVSDPNTVQPPMTGSPDNLLRRAWLDFSCKSLADSYCDMARYARTLRPDILIECNPQGISDRIHSPTDHGRLLQGGEAFWDESSPVGYRDGKLFNRIRTFKVARRMNNIAFMYIITPLEAAESMAFNLDCIGCVCWFEYGKIVAKPGSNETMSFELEPFIDFFHKRRDLLRDVEVIADVAVLRSFPSQVFADSNCAKLTYRVEQALIDNRICFQIIYNQQLDDLKRYRALVLAGCVALSDQDIEHIKKYVKSGGRLCIIGPVATHNQWMLPREKPAFDDLPAQATVCIAEDGDILDAVRQACSNEPTLAVQSDLGLCAELTEQPSRRLVHLVNYLPDKPAKKIAVSLRLPQGRCAESVTLASPEHQQDIKLAFEEQDGLVTFTVPTVNVYEIAIVTLK